MKVALAHDWLTGMRGGEKVLEVLADIYPDAPLYTLVHHPGSVSPALEERDIHTSFLQRLPARDAYRWYLPLFPAAVRTLDVRDYDLVVSSSHCAVKSVIPGRQALHVCYCHTPMRYAWDQFHSYFSPRRNGPLLYPLIRVLMVWLRHWDRATAHRVHAFAANSAHVAARIRRYYDRKATIIPPPVDTVRFTPSGEPPDDFYLVVSALSPYKRIDVAIRAFNDSGRRLVVVGWGPEEDRLRTIAGPGVTLTGKVDDDTLRHLYRRCRGLILPGVEDAGIAPLEAMACGRPALVLAEGGAPEAVEPGVTGLHIGAATPEAVREAVDTAESLSFNSERIRSHAERYSIPSFARAFRQFVEGVRASRVGGSGARPRAAGVTPVPRYGTREPR